MSPSYPLTPSFQDLVKSATIRLVNKKGSDEYRDRFIICDRCTTLVPQIESIRYPASDKLKKYTNDYRARICYPCSKVIFTPELEIC